MARSFLSLMAAGAGAVVLALVAACGEEPGAGPLRPGEELKIKGQTYLVEKLLDGGKVVLTPAAAPTETLGAFVRPVEAWSSSAQDSAGRTARKLIDGSGWGETYPGSAVYVHAANVYEDAGCMWNGMMGKDNWVLFDLGKEYNLAGIYVWNYNEKGGWNTRGVKEMEVLAGPEKDKLQKLAACTLELAPGTDDYRGQAVAFDKPVKARWVRFDIRSNYRGGEMVGLAEVRFANADAKGEVPRKVEFKPKYARPTHPKLAVGQRLDGAENVTYPADAGVIDVTKAPYNAKGDGKTDDTAAIQKALDDWPDKGAIIYLPNGAYLICDTLKWGGKPNTQKRTILQGQSRDGTVIRLQDNCPGYENPRKPKACVWTGKAPAQRFGNEIHNLTVDTGVGNPGACGVQFIANNQGSMTDVTIVSGDGQGLYGLDMGFSDEQGPCLVKNVKVTGFDVGVHTATSVASETLEHIVVQKQNKCGVRNDGQPFTIRGLKSLNDVPAFWAGGGLSVVIDSEFTGEGAASGKPAMVNDAGLVARNVKTSGYRAALENHKGEPKELAGPNIDVFLSKPPVGLFGEPGAMLNLPVKETPDVGWDDPTTWASPRKFGYEVGSKADASDAIQKAIDSGAETVYLPRGTYQIGKTIEVRGKVKKLIGCKAWLDVIEPLKKQEAPLWRVADGSSAVVELEGIGTDFSGGPFFFLEQATERPVVMRRLMINFQKAGSYRNTKKGVLFIEDVVGGDWRFSQQQVWARQFNVETSKHVLNDGGNLWILGFKTEGSGTLIETTNGGATEVLGGLNYIGAAGPEPMFVVDNAAAALSFAEICFTGKPYQIVVRETRGRETRELKRDNPSWGGWFTLFRSGK
jgi:hypothetical protein